MIQPDLTVEAHTSVSVTLGWTCGHNGGDDNMRFELYVSKSGGEFEVYDDSIPADCTRGERNRPDYRVDGLQSGIKYEFEVRAGNEHDLGAALSNRANISHTTICKYQYIIIYLLICLLGINVFILPVILDSYHCCLYASSSTKCDYHMVRSTADFCEPNMASVRGICYGIAAKAW